MRKFGGTQSLSESLQLCAIRPIAGDIEMPLRKATVQLAERAYNVMNPFSLMQSANHSDGRRGKGKLHFAGMPFFAGGPIGTIDYCDKLLRFEPALS